MSTSNRIIKNTIFLSLKTFVSMLLGIFTTRILLEALGESDFGLYNVVGGAIAMMGFITASMSSATQRFINYAEGEGNKNKIKLYFDNSVIIHWGLAALMVAIFIAAAFIFFNGVLNIPDGRFDAAIIVYICMLITAVFSITMVPYEAEINAHEKMLFFSILGIIDVIIKFGIAVSVLYFHSDKLIFYAILMAAESFFLRYAAKYYCKKIFKECRKIEWHSNFNHQIIKEMTSFAGWNLTNIASGMISLFGMNIVINHYFGTNVNAAMGIASQLSGVLMGLSANMIKAVSPIIMKSEGGNQHEKMLQYSYVSCKFSYIIFSICCIPVLFFIHPILKLWLTEVPQWTTVFCIILIISTLIDQLTVVLYQSIMAGGDIKGYNITRSINNILPIIISIVMFQVGNFKPYWILINWGIFKGIVGGAVNLYYSHIKLNLSIYTFAIKVLIPSILSSIATGAIIIFLVIKVDSWTLAFITGAILSLPLYWYIALNNHERNQILSLISIKKCLL